MNNLFTTERIWLMEAESYLQLAARPTQAESVSAVRIKKTAVEFPPLPYQVY